MIIKQIKCYISNYLKSKKRKDDLRYRSRMSMIIKNPKEVFEKVIDINADEWIPCGHPNVFNFSKAYEGQYYYRGESVLSIANATVSDASDIIETSNGVVWSKSEKNNFCVITPRDKNLLEYDSEKVYLYAYKKTEYISGKVVSLLGVGADLWAHFVVQHLPKLFYAGEKGLLNEEITLLCPNYKDDQLDEIVSNYLRQFPNVCLRKVISETYYKCEFLYYIPILVWLGDYSEYLHPSMELFPPRVGGLLKRNLIDPMILKIRESRRFDDYKKVYLVRRNELYRHVENEQELEDAFVKKGFKLIAPHEYTFEEKVDLFYHAEEIVGPLSGGFINTMFCHTGAKVLPFSQICRTVEGYLPFLQSISGIELLLVTGEDRSSSTQCNVFFPLDKVLSAYHYFVKS